MKAESQKLTIECPVVKCKAKLSVPRSNQSEPYKVYLCGCFAKMIKIDWKMEKGYVTEKAEVM